MEHTGLKSMLPRFKSTIRQLFELLQATSLGDGCYHDPETMDLRRVEFDNFGKPSVPLRVWAFEGKAVAISRRPKSLVLQVRKRNREERLAP